MPEESPKDMDEQKEIEKTQRSATSDSDKKSRCPSLPLSSYLPLRKNKRLSQRQRRLRVTQTATNWSKVTKTPGEWSVTVSGINTCGQPVPNVEMKLKFPTGQTNNQPEMEFTEEKQINSVHYQHVEKPKNLLQSDGYLLGGRTFHYLPELIRSGRNQRLTKVIILINTISGKCKQM